MDKKPKLSFQRPVETKDAVDQEEIRDYEPVEATRMEKKTEYQPEEGQTQLEVSTENYIDTFIYFHNLCKEKMIPQEQVLFLWQLFISPVK